MLSGDASDRINRYDSHWKNGAEMMYFYYVSGAAWAQHMNVTHRQTDGTMIILALFIRQMTAKPIDLFENVNDEHHTAGAIRHRNNKIIMPA